MRVRKTLTAIGFATLLAAGPAGAHGFAPPEPVNLPQPPGIAATQLLKSLSGNGVVELLGQSLLLHRTGVIDATTRFTSSDVSGLFSEVALPHITTIAGTVRGDPSSLVSLAATSTWVSGLIQTSKTTWWLEPDDWSDPTETLVLTDRSSSALPLALSPRSDALLPHVAGVPQIGAGIANCQVFTCDRLHARVVLDGDSFLLALDKRKRLSACILGQVAAFNAMTAIYARDPIKLDLTIAQINCHTTADLGRAGTHMEDVLTNLQTFWNARPDVDRSAVQLSSGFDFGLSGPLGISFLGGVCQRVMLNGSESRYPQYCPNGYNVVQDAPRKRTGYNASPFLRIKLNAHELAHNWNAVHDATQLCPAKAPRKGPIMCAFVQESGSNRFSPDSAKAIRDWAEQNVGSATGS